MLGVSNGEMHNQKHETCFLLGRELAHTKIEQPNI